MCVLEMMEEVGRIREVLRCVRLTGQLMLEDLIDEQRVARGTTLWCIALELTAIEHLETNSDLVAGLRTKNSLYTERSK